MPGKENPDFNPAKIVIKTLAEVVKYAGQKGLLNFLEHRRKKRLGNVGELHRLTESALKRRV